MAMSLPGANQAAIAHPHHPLIVKATGTVPFDADT